MPERAAENCYAMGEFFFAVSTCQCHPLGDHTFSVPCRLSAHTWCHSDNDACDAVI